MLSVAGLEAPWSPDPIWVLCQGRNQLLMYPAVELPVWRSSRLCRDPVPPRVLGAQFGGAAVCAASRTEGGGLVMMGCGWVARICQHNPAMPAEQVNGSPLV